ncbi:MAG: hypothetical protein Q9174_006155 [Haloplaca sp. 1 TL-2023]
MSPLSHYQRQHNGISLYHTLSLITHFTTTTAMPYHLLSRPQQTKDSLFRQSPLAQNPDSHHLPKPPNGDLNESRHITVPEPLIAAIQTSSRHIIPRVPPPRGRFSRVPSHQTAASNTSFESDARPILITFWVLLITLSLLWSLYILYLRLRLGHMPSSMLSLPWLDRHTRQKRKKSAYGGASRSAALRGLPSTSSFGGLNRRKKAPPRELDLEALGLRQRRESLPVIEAGRLQDGIENESSGTSSGYSAGAGARALASMVTGDVSPAIATGGWSSGSSLAEKGVDLVEQGSQLVEKEWGMMMAGMVGGKVESEVLPVVEDVQKQDDGLGKYFKKGGVGIWRESSGDSGGDVEAGGGV